MAKIEIETLVTFYSKPFLLLWNNSLEASVCTYAICHWNNESS